MARRIAECVLVQGSGANAPTDEIMSGRADVAPIDTADEDPRLAVLVLAVVALTMLVSWVAVGRYIHR